MVGTPVAGRLPNSPILGDSDFVKKMLAQSEEALERKVALEAKGIGIEDIAARVAQLLEMTYDALWLPGKYQKQVAARSLLCFWAVNELGCSVTAIGKKLGISAPAVSKSVRRCDYSRKRLYARVKLREKGRPQNSPKLDFVLGSSTEFALVLIKSAIE